MQRFKLVAQCLMLSFDYQVEGLSTRCRHLYCFLVDLVDLVVDRIQHQDVLKGISPNI